MPHIRSLGTLFTSALILYSAIVLTFLYYWNRIYVAKIQIVYDNYENTVNLVQQNNFMNRQNNQMNLTFNEENIKGQQSTKKKGQDRLFGWRDDLADTSTMDKVAFQLMDYKPPIYTDTRAPCFYVPKQDRYKKMVHPTSNITILRCLPSVFLIGAVKSGTTDLYTYLTMHRHVIRSRYKEPKFWNINSFKPSSLMTFGQYLKNYDRLAMLNSRCFLRPAENLCKSYIMWRSSRVYDSNELKQIARNGGRSPLVGVDASVTYFDSTIYWQDDPLNKGSDEILVYTPHRIKHFIPHAKIILILRNPVERLISDFYFFVDGSGKLNPDLFHTLVVNGIDWWNNCLKVLPESKCAFGVNFTDAGLPDLNPGIFSWGELPGDGNNGAARVRIGLYCIYLEKWLDVFDEEDILVIQMERYNKNISHVLEQEVLPFLDLDPYSQTEWDMIHKEQTLAPHNTNKKKQRTDGVHQKTRKLLDEFYRPYNIRLSKLLRNEFFI